MLTPRRRTSSYNEEEVRALIEDYESFRAMVDTSRRGLRYLVMVADLDRALAQLPQKYWEVVLLHGLIGLPQRETAHVLHVSQQAVGKRYRQGLEEVIYVMNGGE